MTIVRQLGSIIELKNHCGWTGKSESSWKSSKLSSMNFVEKTKSLHEIDGQDSIFYWVDLTSEMVFYLAREFVDQQTSDMRIFIVWLEDFDDDLDSMIPNQETSTKTREISIIAIRPLKNGLFRISLNGNAQRFGNGRFFSSNRNGICFFFLFDRMQSGCATIPLMDGLILPLSILPFYLRQSVHSLNRRKRLEDSQRFENSLFLCRRTKEKMFILIFSSINCFSSQTAYSLRKSRIARIIDKYQQRSDHLDEYFHEIFLLSNVRTTTVAS